MTAPLKILVVDDNAELRATCSTVLIAAGYEVATAEDGFTGLLALARAVPDLILCDLSLPRMSGFEFLSLVRRRFPEVRVVAMSDVYVGDINPGGVLADAFCFKGQSPSSFVGTIASLLQSSSSSSQNRELAEVWIPLNAKDSHGKPYFVATCPECFRTFPLPIAPAESPAILKSPCMFCAHEVSYKNDFSRLITMAENAAAAKLPTPTQAAAIEGSTGAFEGEIAIQTPFI
jgi:hypothetical protein